MTFAALQSSFLSQAEYQRCCAAGYNRIPLVQEALADLDTPLSLYLKLACVQGVVRPWSFLLESVKGGESFGRYSFIGLPCRTHLRAHGFGDKAVCEVVQDGAVLERATGNPLDFVQTYKQRFRLAQRDGLPRFCGGLAGYFAYDVVRHIEPTLIPSCPPDTLGTPDILLMQCEELAVIDNVRGRLYLIVLADGDDPDGYAKACARLAQLQQLLLISTTLPLTPPTQTGAVNSSFTQSEYEQAVLQVKEWIAAGQIFQLVFGQRITKPFTASPLSLYRALRSLNPSPYMYYYHMGDHHVVGASPEILVRHEATAAGTKVTIRPLAGTRPRGQTPEQDAALEAELLADAKERAEHVMLIDLARNDIGRIAQIGSVNVTETFAIERYSHVMHIMSNVEGLLQPGLEAMDVLRACFPAGTLSGTPKVRAMQLIDTLEPVKRGVYAGAVGYLSHAGDMDLAIAIRTAIIHGGQLHVQAAAGIVADSVPHKEWEETLHKAWALLRAAELVEKGAV